MLYLSKIRPLCCMSIFLREFEQSANGYVNQKSL